KLTSLTLMTIMLAGGMTIAAPSMMPQAAAAGQLYVSAENATFGNVFGGAQVIEVIVRDPNRDETDEAQAEPTVRVDNYPLRMAQGDDGFWYAYYGDKTQIPVADAANNNLDFGSADVGISVVTNTTGPVYQLPQAGVVGNAPTLSNHTQTTALNGQIGLNMSAADDTTFTATTNSKTGPLSAEWPFIQTFDLTIGEHEVILEQPGADEIVVVDYDSADLDDYSYISLDRNSASQGSEVHLTIVDNQLNIDPTSEDVVLFYVADGEEGVSFTDGSSYASTNYLPYDNAFGDNGKLIINNNTNSAAQEVLAQDQTLDDVLPDNVMVFWESGENTGIFVNTDDDDDANLFISNSAQRGTTATFDYNDEAQSLVVANFFGTIDMDETTLGGEWNSGETLIVTLIDEDLNKNTALDEDLLIANSTLIPSLQIGSPLTLGNDTHVESDGDAAVTGAMTTAAQSQANLLSFSKMVNITSTASNLNPGLEINSTTTVHEFRNAYGNATFAFVNFDVTTVLDQTDTATSTAIVMQDSDGTSVATVTAITADRGITQITAVADEADHIDEDSMITFNFTGGIDANETGPKQIGDSIFVDIFTFGGATTDDSTDARTNNAIYRMELEETGDNTSTFVGEIEYIMLNQLNRDVVTTYSGITPISDEIVIIVHEDLTDEDSPRLNYLDLGADGVSTQIADQVEAPSHSGTVSFDSDNYKIADTVVITLEDQDMNTDSDLIDVYITSTDDKVGDGSGDHVIDVTYDDLTWVSSEDDSDCAATDITGDDGLEATGFTLVETGLDSGIFVGSFQVPTNYCKTDGAAGNTDEVVTVTGTDIEVNYNDFRDASGEKIEVGAGASINANTGSVAFDRNVYPVPFGNESGASTTDKERFALHASAANLDGGSVENALAQGDVTVHIRVTDQDYNISASGEDTISDTTVVMKIDRGSSSVDIATVGNSANPITEVSPDSGVFEYDQTVTFADGPDDDACPATFALGCILQGDIITVTYTDLYDASGKSQTVTDSATFDLRNGVLQSDKSVYLIGSDMILTLIEPDFDLDNDGAESYTLDLIEWDSDAATSTMGAKGISGANAAFDPEPSMLRETGDSTGIFQVVIEIPAELDSTVLDRGEMIELEYTDWGPAGADYVGQEDEDIGLTVYTSNFGATVELDQKVYTWTDKVYITIVAPDHNFDSGLVDEIGNTDDDPIKVSTRGNELKNYKLVESGADTGIFIGEVTLAGMTHDVDGDGTNDVTTISGGSSGTGPTEGQLAATDNDGLTVSFEFSEDETVVGSALIRWNIGEVQWLEASYPASGTGVIRVIDADMNLDPEAIDNFDVDAWSDSDAGGIDLTVTETNEATGIFEGTVFFTTANDSSGHRLRVAEGDTVTAEYEDNTLPEPYTTADELDITATSLIGTVVPPLERAPAANLRTVDAFGNSLNAVSVDQQVQLTADLANGQDRDQSFAYLVQVQDGDGVTVSLAWITGSLSSGQSFSPALSWIPTESGSYTATAFVWESVDNPTALSPPVSTTISVQ
ncbi:hypothetical protein OAP30_07295, partial [Nitrosopumilus sp.]|nr:hypothetical protein [Nitrosopumilus sp.]